MSACLFNSLPDGEYLNVLIVAAFFNSLPSGEISSSTKNSYLPTFLHDKLKFLAGFLSILYCIVLLNFISSCFIFLI